MTDSPGSYLPTFEGALSEGLDVPSERPLEQQRLAMLVVHAAVVRRSSWSEEVVRPTSGIPHGEPPVPEDFEVRHHVRIANELGKVPCQFCERGSRPCRVCGGTGKLGARACSCEGGRIRCPSCEGAGRGSRLMLRYYTDTPASMCEAYMPSQVGFVKSLFRLESTMETDIGFMREMPEVLRCHDLTGRVGGSAYRGGVKLVRPEFHGHEFGDAIEKAIAGLAAFGTGAVRYDIRAYAWPFLWLHYHEADYAVYRTRTGELRAYGGSAL
ncbi:hypothetical protein [Polyangium aurulentum]|uniref:hypothetical protein n=1 Tax=Polyangium aurulentum TaxID=2567896 RepID=UPI0010AE4822|nr:hypothetical protein [Polyangium aurulentum]UQA62029.1 hypothetical protein E8A73_016755 [Polyangium aurulentum]